VSERISSLSGYLIEVDQNRKLTPLAIYLFTGFAGLMALTAQNPIG
jgi:hypothetical protein